MVAHGEFRPGMVALSLPEAIDIAPIVAGQTLSDLQDYWAYGIAPNR
ncbi:MAG: hypothetical protein ACRDP7_07760 [Trebonia sp.]